MKTKVLLLSLLATAALASCGGGGDTGDSSNAGDSGNASGSSITPIGAAVELTLWAGESDDAATFLTEVANDFKAQYPTINYQFQIKAVSESSVSGDWALDPAKAADFAIAADDQIPAMIKSNLINNLESIDKAIPGLSTDIKTRNSEESVEMVTDSDKTWGFPVSASNGYILYYNSDYIREEDTATFESLLARIKEVSLRDNKTYRFGFPYNSGWYLDGYFHGAGFSAYGEGGKSTVECNWNATIKDAFGNDISGKDVAGSLVRLANGEYQKYWTSQEQQMIMTQIGEETTSPIIATINGTWNYKRIQRTWGDAAKATTLPSYHVELADRDYSMQSVKGFKIGVINQKRKNVLHAARFAEFITNAENQKKRFEQLSEAPTNKEAATKIDVDSNPAVKALNTQWEKGSFIEKVNESFWNPSNSLSTLLCNGGDKGKYNYLKDPSKAGTADIEIDYDAIQDILDGTVAKLAGTSN